MNIIDFSDLVKTQVFFKYQKECLKEIVKCFFLIFFVTKYMVLICFYVVFIGFYFIESIERKNQS